MECQQNDDNTDIFKNQSRKPPPLELMRRGYKSEVSYHICTIYLESTFAIEILQNRHRHNHPVVALVQVLLHNLLFF
jgi:hypothetical protein